MKTINRRAARSRRRAGVLAGASLPFGLVFSATLVFLPLWATQDLGLTAGQWAGVLASRQVGVLLTMVALCLVAPRLGPRRLSCLAMAGAGIALGSMGVLGQTGLPVAIGVYGGMISAGFVGFSTLTQLVSQRRAGSANTLFRSVMSAGRLIGPPLATGVAGYLGGYRAVMLAGGVMLVGAAVVVSRYPLGRDTRPEPWLTTPRQELRRLVRVMVDPLRRRPLQAYIHATELSRAIAIAAPGFVAIRYVQELGGRDAAVGFAASAGSLAVLLVSVRIARLLDHGSLRWVSYGLLLLCGLALTAAGLSDRPAVLFGALALCTLGMSLGGAPMSLWVGRVAGPLPLAGVFAHHKLMSAAYGAAVAAVIGLVERIVSLNHLLLVCGIAIAVTALPVMLLREPTAEWGKARSVR
ncbi:MAG: MFS transporter [Planctomycetota bacterium]